MTSHPAGSQITERGSLQLAHARAALQRHDLPEAALRLLLATIYLQRDRPQSDASDDIADLLYDLDATGHVSERYDYESGDPDLLRELDRMAPDLNTKMQPIDPGHDCSVIDLLKRIDRIAQRHQLSLATDAAAEH